MIEWSKIRMYAQEGGELDAEETYLALMHYRRDGSVYGAYFVEPAEFDAPEDEGPSVDEIDWTGFDEQ